MSDLRELYQDVILDHGKHPRNRRAMADANRHAHGRNPLCGDDFEITLKLDASGRIADAAFDGSGCAISVASASIMTELLKGKTHAEADSLFEGFHALCTTGEAPSDVPADDLMYLEVVAGVRQFPVRVKCATLAWHTMKAALEGQPSATSDIVPSPPSGGEGGEQREPGEGLSGSMNVTAPHPDPLPVPRRGEKS